MDASSAEDALGVVDLLLPGERETMRQPLIDIVDNLKRLEIADSSASLDKIGGLDIAFENVQVEPTADQRRRHLQHPHHGDRHVDRSMARPCRSASC